MRWAFALSVAAFTVGAGVLACSSDDAVGPGVYVPPNYAPYRDAGYVYDPPAVTPDASPKVYPTSTVALGDGFACVVGADRNVWCWGKNDVGQLGSDPTTMTTKCGDAPCSATPTQVQGVSLVDTVIAGSDFACAIAGGHLWCWGGNAKNQILGGDDVPSRFTPQIAVYAGFTSVVAHGQRMCMITTDGFVECWGDNSCNLFGRNDDAGVSPIWQVGSLLAMQQVSLGDDAMCSVDPAGDVYCWGTDHNGSLGRPVPAGKTCNGLPFDGVPRQVMASASATFGNAAEVHVGDGLACARTNDNAVWCWGDNTHGGLGQGLPDTSAHMNPVAVPAIETVKLAVGGETACAMVEGSPVCWGDAEYGQMDSLGADAGCGGSGCRPIGYVIPNQSNGRDVFVSADSIATIKADLSLWSWGRNDWAESAVAPTDPANVPCASGSTCIPDPRQITTAPPLD